MYKYKYVKATLGGLFTEDNYQEIIDQHAKESWRLVQVLPINHSAHGIPTRYEIIFEREVDECLDEE